MQQKIEERIVEITIVFHRKLPVNYDLVAYEKQVHTAYANMMKDPNIKVHVKG